MSTPGCSLPVAPRLCRSARNWNRVKASQALCTVYSAATRRHLPTKRLASEPAFSSCARSSVHSSSRKAPAWIIWQVCTCRCHQGHACVSFELYGERACETAQFIGDRSIPDANTPSRYPSQDPTHFCKPRHTRHAIERCLRTPFAHPGHHTATRSRRHQPNESIPEERFVTWTTSAM
jgi:hypothetical protein